VSGQLTGRFAVVTGGSRGIGRAIVTRLAKDGADVLLTYRADLASAEKAVAEASDHGVRAVAVQCDLARKDAAATLFAAIDAHLAATGRTGVDIVVNNAGVAFATMLTDVTEEEYDTVMAVNARSVFFVMKHAVARLHDHGRIVNITSVNTTASFVGQSVYSATKAAVEQFTRVAARELGPRGITVNTVAPGVTDTDPVRAALPPGALDGVVAMTPLGRLGAPEDIAGVVAFLAGTDAAWITGQHIRVDGGMV
jgi:3-oxoacyl-[acyl-carrier protein] reductase